MATQSSILTWKIPWIEGPGGLQSKGHKELDMTEHSWIYCIQSCMELFFFFFFPAQFRHLS